MPAGHEYDHETDKGRGAIAGDYSREQVGPEAGHVVTMARPADLDGDAPGVKFFGNRLCPFAHRSWWIAKEVGVPHFQYLHVDMGGPVCLPRLDGLTRRTP